MTTQSTTTLAPVADDVATLVPWPTHTIAVDGRAESHLDQEWLLTNGTGAYAMGTVAGANTRRYHGLLIACTRPPVGRIVAINQLFEQLRLTIDGSERVLDLSSCLFRDDRGREVFAPQGHENLRSFQKGLSVAWTYSYDALDVTRVLHVHWKEQAATVRYVLDWKKGAGKVTRASLRLSPLMTLRDFHSLQREDHALFKVQAAGDRATVARGDVTVTMQCPGSTFTAGGDWWRHFFYNVEAERGQDCIEDAFLPGAFEQPLRPGQRQVVQFMVTLGTSPAGSVEDSTRARQSHLHSLISHLHEPGEALQRTLAIAADDFVVDRSIQGRKLSTVLAGYPWFADWGRDTFIALPGLMIESGRFDEARATLRVFAQAMQDGLIPNRFDDYHDQAAHYNTVDASLWFVHTALLYLAATKDEQSWNDWLAPAAMNVIDAYIKGTRYDIRMAGDALISAGSTKTQLTWMDAACGDVVFTPRHGKAVEINALWYSDLVGMAEALRNSHGDVAKHYDKLAARVNRSFAKVFWNDDRNCLNDHVWTDEQGADHVDHSLRPNQIFAVSLPHSPLPRTKQVLVVDAVREKLLTPYGLRTLPADDARYHARYTGGPFQRDEAYHQGTIWPWLMGPYCEAVLRVGRFSAASKSQVRQTIEPLLRQLQGAGLGQLHEIHEADAPHRPVGCIAQAWSVAELLRVLQLLHADK